jgi:hypothetical protein
VKDADWSDRARQLTQMINRHLHPI